VIRDELYNSLVAYLNSKDVIVAESDIISEISKLEIIDEKRVIQQLENISNFHKNIIGFKGYMGKRLDNKTGSTVEQYKMNIKRLKRYMKNIRVNGASSNFERVLLKKGNEYIQRAEVSITEAYNSGYMNILERSMKRNEICLGNTNFSNLMVGEKLSVVSLDKCAYNNVEMDCYYLLSKLKRKGIKLNYKALIKNFCELEALDQSSYRFIAALLSYPFAFMKCCNRYREKTKEWSEKEFEENLEWALNKDGDSLLGG
jgi:hypothetical protein